MTDYDPTRTVALELSRTRWVVGVLSPRGMEVTISTVPGGDTERLLADMHKVVDRLTQEFGRPVDLKICYEAS